ncbi:MAG TPA: LamG-like jellyroll fold domain-containing protein [Micromonosporaceae bacterium]
MRWTTVCDLRFQEYGSGVAKDRSRFGNDAWLGGGVVTHDGSVTLPGGPAELVLRVDGDSLQRFSGLQVHVEVRPTDVGRRQNLVEGWMSFALYLQPDGQPVATIYDGQNWVAVSGGPGDVPFQDWSQVSFTYDGIGQALLAVDERPVGASSQMPLGMRQPRQNITIGHWPSGDDRYTLCGDLAGVLLRRRDYEDLFRDAVDAMLCSRDLTDTQMGAVLALRQRLATLSADTVRRLRACAQAQYHAVTELIHDLRQADPEATAQLGAWTDRLLQAWCCHPDPLEIRLLTEQLLQTSLTAGQRQRIKVFLAEFERAGAACDWDSPPLDRLRELFARVVPELVYLSEQVPRLTSTL